MSGPNGTCQNLIIKVTKPMTTFLLCIVAYLIGAIPTGVVLTRLTGAADVRTAGSGNIGATNVYRVAGKKLGILTLVGDALKGVLPTIAAQSWLQFEPSGVALVAVAAFLGHCYPIYLGFKGGKGVATALGIFLVLSPLSVLIAVLVFALLLWRTRYVSLGSICAAGLMPLMILLLERNTSLFFASLVIGGMVVFRHRANIDRLIRGVENKFGADKTA
jgi:acyl phosphate:glycerol-3-phosphate acyltransferase